MLPMSEENGLVFAANWRRKPLFTATFGLGLDELSMSSPRIPAVKSQLRHLDSQACRALASQACECRSAQEIEALLNQFAPEKEVRPLLALENIFVGEPLSNKEQVIQFLCGNLWR
nr:phosphoenolpyruvate-protein phosphotransferase [Salmonella sp. NCTC 7297]